MKDQTTEICKQLKNLHDSGAKKVRCVMFVREMVESVFEVILNDPEYRSPILKSGKPASFFKPWIVPTDRFEISVLSMHEVDHVALVEKANN